MVMCLGQGADLRMAQLMPLPLVAPVNLDWFYLPGRLTRVVPDKIQQGRKKVVCGGRLQKSPATDSSTVVHKPLLCCCLWLDSSAI